MKQNRQLSSFDEDIRRNTLAIDKLKASIHKLATAQTNIKFAKSDFVVKEDVVHLKERINHAFSRLLQLHEQSMDRDAVICESLLDTQLGKLKRLIVKRHTHDALKEFLDELNEPFSPPDIHLSLKAESAWL